MRAPENAILADRLAIALRWLTLFGIVALLAGSGTLSVYVQVSLILAALWNSGLTVLSLLQRRLPSHPLLSIFVDNLIGVALFVLSQSVIGAFPWVGFIPLVSAALYYGPAGGLFQAGVNIMLLGNLMLVGSSLAEAGTQILVMVLIYLAIGALLGYASRELGFLLREQGLQGPGGQRGQGGTIERERLKAVYSITSTLTSTLNYPRVLELALDVSSSVLTDTEDSQDKLVSGFLLFKGENLQVGSARRFTPADLRTTLPAREGILARAIEEAMPCYGVDPSRDPELSRFVALRACQAVYCYPLSSGLEVYGVLVFAHPDRAYFSDVRREILEVIGRQAKVAIVNARLYQELSEEKERILEIQEDARRRLARNLHDGPTQSVAAIAMRVNFARRLMERDAKEAGNELFKVEDLARRTTKEMRHMLFTLRPLVLESSGLKAALESMAEKMKETYGQNVTLEIEAKAVNQLEMGKQAVVFYIAEESINNVRKHAEAKHTWVRLRMAREDIVLLEVEDDGIGFDLEAVVSAYEAHSSLGLVNMRERTELISGELQIDSEVGKGTCVRVWVPVTEAAGEKLRHGV